jgi:SAM-dependent methyltransferase
MLRSFISKKVKKYNYISWLDYIKNNWDFGVLGTSVIDLGCNDGGLLSSLSSYSNLTQMVGLDSDVSVVRHNKVNKELRSCKFFVANFCDPEFMDFDFGNADTVYFMNTFFVLPDVQLLAQKIRISSFKNLIISYPLPATLSIYEKNNPGQNFLENNFDQFISDCGFTIHKEADVTSYYYLGGLGVILLASINRALIRLFEKNGARKFYRLAWATRIEIDKGLKNRL